MILMGILGEKPLLRLARDKEGTGAIFEDLYHILVRKEDQEKRPLPTEGVLINK